MTSLVTALFGGDCCHALLVKLPRWPMTKQEVVDLCPERCHVCGGKLDRTIHDGNLDFGLDFDCHDGAY